LAESLFTDVSNESSPCKQERVLALVCHFVAEVIGIPANDVYAESTLIDLGADSFHFIDITCRLESEFRIVLPESFAAPHRSSLRMIASEVSRRIDAKRIPAEPLPRVLWNEP
jgi:acyl carrier protein